MKLLKTVNEFFGLETVSDMAWYYSLIAITGLICMVALSAQIQLVLS
jgi:hypothetical protein